MKIIKKLLLFCSVLLCSISFLTANGQDETGLNDITSLELADVMGNGINLGNTMEAYGHKYLGVDAEVSAYETLWGQPVTTPEMIQKMKESGFDSIRIPVAWTNMMDYESGDYTINQKYLDRVAEIVGYALDADMYVIINDHWDGGWWGMFGSKTQETRDAAMDLYISMWTQVGNHFKEYSHKLIFESANEELGSRLNDADVAADSGSLREDDTYRITNEINQKFVDVIRSLGGKNSNRFLLIAGFNTDIVKTTDDRFKMPKDKVKDKLLLSVHYYTPWSYCGTDSVSSWGTEKNYNTQNDLLEKMTKFTKQGYGIVFGEYAVLTTKDGKIKNNTEDFTRNFLDNCDLYGYVPMLWDCSDFFKRRELKIVDDGLRNLFAERSLSSQSDLSKEEIKQKTEKSMAKSLDEARERDANTVVSGPVLNGDEDAVAWLMYNSNDYGITYSVGDTYDSSSKTTGVIPADLKITEAGTYTVGLDFTKTALGYANSTSFSAVAVSNGELLFPGYIMDIKEILINGKKYKTDKIAYTTSDDGRTTRVNLFNEWVTELPEGARAKNKNMIPYASAMLLDKATLGNVETITVTFEYKKYD